MTPQNVIKPRRHNNSRLIPHSQGQTGSKKRPWIFSKIGPPQLQYKQSLYLTILQQSCCIYGKSNHKTHGDPADKTIETITDILRIYTTNNITNYQLLTIKIIK